MNNSQSFSKNLLTYQKYTQEALVIFFDDLKKKNYLPEEDVRMLEEFVHRGGKRIRGYLLTLGYRMNGGEMSEAISSFSLGIELGHAGLLIQDDIFDQDQTRRNKSSFHVSRNGPMAMHESIVLSDMLVALGYSQMLNADINPTLKYAALQYLNIHALRTAEGERRDLQGGELLKDTEIREIAELKTASYTTHATLVVGALLAGNKAPIELFEKIAKDLGFLFQLRDDFLTVYADLETVGKDVFSDFKNNRSTLLTSAVSKKSPNSIISDIHTREQLYACISKAEIDALFDDLTLTSLKRIEACATELAESHDIPVLELLECAKYVIHRSL